MVKRLQNKISESRITLPVVAVYAAVIWLACGLIPNQWWIQFVCFAVSTYLMIELNNSNALIRIYSKMVSSSFLMLSVCCCFLFASLKGAITEMLVIATYGLLYKTYQEQEATGKTYYAFLCMGLASLANVHVLYYVPALWMLMGLFLKSLSVKNILASILGVLTPYWLGIGYLTYIADYSMLTEHVAKFTAFNAPFDFSILSLQQITTLGFTVVLAATGIIHYLNTSFYDKIRIRMMYYCFICMTILTAMFIVVQPQHYDMLMRMMIINTCPLIAHFMALTSTRITNIAFCLIILAILSLTGYNLWIVL